MMTQTDWNPEDEPEVDTVGAIGWGLALFRLAGIAAVIYGLMIVLALTRLVEIPFKKRLVSPAIVQLACKGALRILGLAVTTRGHPMRHKGAVVCNHVSWLDIFTLNATQRGFFVAKSEVAKWPVVGFIARATSAVFITRDPSQAKRQKTQFEDRLIAGDRLIFFPEGTSTDGLRVLAFKSTLFAAFFEPHLVDTMWIQPVTTNYVAPEGRDARFYGWWGEMAFFPSFLKSLAATRAGRVEIVFHQPVAVADFDDRKALARYCQQVVRGGLTTTAG